MLYNVVKFIVQISLRAYFKKVEIIGREHLEYGRAVYVSNHPGAMIDPILIAMNADKPFHYIAGAEWFGKGLKNWIFRKQFNMIPVYRPWLAKNKEQELQRNDEMFDACFESLEAGERIMIFPEASSMTVPWIRSLKTGAARIKIGADAYLALKNQQQEMVKIVPIGINYQNPHRFQTRATIVIGHPIDFSALNKDMEPMQLASEMTSMIKDAMQQCVLHMEEEALYPMIKQVIKIMEPLVINDLNIDSTDPAASFKARKEIVAAVEHYYRKSPEILDGLAYDLNSYIRRFEAHGFRKFNPFEERGITTFLRWLKVVGLLPVFLLGFLVNVVPFVVGRGLFRKLLLEKVSGEHKQGDFNPAFAGSLAYAVSVLVFLFWYAFISIAASQLYTWWVAVPVALFIAYHSGRVALLYFRWLKRLRDVWHWNSMPKHEREDLLNERRGILRKLQLLKLQYLRNLKP
jgi:1-acyl-sn-glycerol-3-phosphate acyltransferase